MGMYGLSRERDVQRICFGGLVSTKNRMNHSDPTRDAISYAILPAFVKGVRAGYYASTGLGRKTSLLGVPLASDRVFHDVRTAPRNPHHLNILKPYSP